MHEEISRQEGSHSISRKKCRVENGFLPQNGKTYAVKISYCATSAGYRYLTVKLGDEMMMLLYHDRLGLGLYLMSNLLIISVLLSPPVESQGFRKVQKSSHFFVPSISVLSDWRHFSGGGRQQTNIKVCSPEALFYIIIPIKWYIFTNISREIKCI